jgi:hypothetical protein
MMQRLLAGLLVVCGLALASAAPAQQVYKWVDDKGVTHYGEKPPSGRPSQPVDTTPSGYVREPGDAGECHTIRCQYDRLRSERLHDEAQRRADEQTAAAQRAASPRARGMSFDTFRKLETGMPEGEVLLRAGPPDYQSNQFLSSGYLGKTWYYYPTRSDPFTTVIQISGGQVFSLDRVRQF